MPLQLAHKFSLLFKHNIWEVRASGSYVLITTRDTEQLQVAFSLFDIDKNNFIWQDISFEESWWISVYHFSGEMIVFQTYTDTQDIEARSIFGFDLKTMEANWSINDVSVRLRGKSWLEVCPIRDETAGSFVINIKTGETTEHFPKAPHSPGEPGQIAPNHYEADSPHFKTLADFLQSKWDMITDGSCDYLETNDFFIISANSKSEKYYDLNLFVFDHSGNLLLREKLDSDMKGLATGTFFILNQTLIFVREKRNLVFYSF